MWTSIERFLTGTTVNKALTLPGEGELITLIKMGDQSAFKLLYYHYANKTLIKILRLVKSHHVAEEILQDVFLKIWEKRVLLNGNTIGPLINKIAQNKIYDYLRKSISDRKIQEALSSHFINIVADPSHLLQQKEYREIFERALDNLPSQQRNVFKLCKMENYSYQEVSKRLGITISTVNIHLVKANKALKEYLSAHHDILMPLVISLMLTIVD